MTCSVRILTTQTLDSSPAVLLVSPDGSKTLVNCGEGCQRSFLELSQKVSTVNRICLTHLCHSSIGGLPGLILTSSDVTAAAMENAKAVLHKSPGALPFNDLNEIEESKPGLDLIGPRGTQTFCRSLRHFMRREKFEVRVKEGEYSQPVSQQSKPKKRKRNGKVKIKADESFSVSSIAFDHDNRKDITGEKRENNYPSANQILSFVFTSPPILGKFLADKAKELGIPPGPLYGQLKSGQTVTFQDKEGKEKCVESREVVEPGNPGIRVAVLYYPSNEVLEQMKVSTVINEMRNCVEEKQPKLEIIVHIAPRDIFNSSECNDWLEGFGSDVQHVYLESAISLERYNEGYADAGTPFKSAALGALSRSLLSHAIYRTPLSPKVSVEAHEQSRRDNLSIREASPLLEYTIIPRAKKGFTNGETIAMGWDEVDLEAKSSVQSTGALALAKDLLQDVPHGKERGKAEIIFTGTGSAIPCKHRNVSGIYVRMDNGNSILLDAGEGTTGQLLRANHGVDYLEVLEGVKAVWISHPHADHHLGILRLLTERQRISKSENDPVILIAPPNLKYFLQEYAQVDPTIIGSYEFLDCYQLISNARRESWSEDKTRHHNDSMKQLEHKLGITSIQAIPVSHCRHAFAVILRGTSFGNLAYSGDCRPSVPFARAGLGVDLLIHEATFSDGMEMEASVKRHCTVGEALDVATNMQAKAVVLTHFSQRYPKVPPLPSKPKGESDAPVIFAFDFAVLTPQTLTTASKITPALRLLFPDENDDDEGEASTAKAALDIPGFFAQGSVL